MANDAAQSLATIATLLDMARDVADKLPANGDPSRVELVAAIATSQFCALRLATENAQPRRIKRTRN